MDQHEDWTTAEALGDRYVLRTRVGSGRTTTVYAADDVRLQRPVALKLFDDFADDEAFARFATEARVLGGLSHPGLVTVYDANLQADRPYLVMRLVDGEPLSTRIQHVGLEPAAVAQLGAQLADVLDYVHERGVVHGDLDAADVLVDARGDGHLTGFGADQRLHPSGDVYALGMMLADLVPADLGPEWHAVLSAMTDRDPDRRPDAQRCGELLRNIASGDTNAFALPTFDDGSLPIFDDERAADDPDDADDPVEAVAGSVPEPRGKRMRPAYTGFAGMGLAITALAIVVATVNTGTAREPAGEEQQNSPAEQKPGESQANPPAQTYPRGSPEEPGRRAQEKPAEPAKKPKPPSSSSSTTTTTRPPSQDDDDGGPGDGPGNGNGNGNGEDNGRGNGGLIGIIIGGLG
jgi:eukaryotic-like serine/threonine-protein kinase